VSPAELVGALLGDAEEPSNIDEPQQILAQDYSQPEPLLSASRPYGSDPETVYTTPGSV
jgi:hypothetical protein